MKHQSPNHCPVPVNVVLKDILNSEDDERYAVVGLNAYAIFYTGIRKAQAKVKSCRRKLSYVLG